MLSLMKYNKDRGGIFSSLYTVEMSSPAELLVKCLFYELN